MLRYLERVRLRYAVPCRPASQPRDQAHRRFMLGCQELGPILRCFCRRLYRHLWKLSLEGDATLLWVSRGGLRLRYLFDLWLKANQCSMPFSRSLPFYTSRLATGAACLYSDYRYVRQVIEAEFRSGVMPELVQDLLTNEERVRREYESLAQYLEYLAGPTRRFILIDTGAMGTVLRLCIRSFPQYDWRCALFAFFNYRDIFGWEHYMDRITGIWLTFSKHPSHRRAEHTALLLCYHLIEDPLEPRFESVVSMAPSARVYPAVDESLIEPQPGDDIFAGIVQAVVEPRDAAETEAEAEAAYRRLKRMITHPRKDEVELLDMGARGADFGRACSFRVIIRHSDDHQGRLGAPWRCYASLWPPGQIRYEFPRLAWPLQWLFLRYMELINRYDRRN